MMKKIKKEESREIKMIKICYLLWKDQKWLPKNKNKNHPRIFNYFLTKYTEEVIKKSIQFVWVLLDW